MWIRRWASSKKREKSKARNVRPRSTYVDLGDLIRNGDRDGVERAIEADPMKLNAVITPSKGTPLLWALHPNSGNHPEIAWWLIRHGADLNAKTNNGDTALMLACRYDQPRTVEVLVQERANLNLQDREGRTALMIAGCLGQTDTITALIRHRADLNLRDNKGQTALMHACRDGQFNVASALIEHGAKIQLKDHEGWTALVLACRDISSGQLLMRFVKLLWVAGASLQAEAENFDDVAEMFSNIFSLNFSSVGNTLFRSGVQLAAKYYQRDDVVRFCAFVMESDIARILSRLKQPRSVAFAFFERGWDTMESCSNIQYENLVDLGVTSGKQRELLRQLNPRAPMPQTNQAPASQAPRFQAPTSQALISQPPASQPLASLPPASQPPASQPPASQASASQAQLPSSSGATPTVPQAESLPATIRYDAFLAHNWGVDERNHELVRRLNDMIIESGRITWFDGKRLTGHFQQQLSQGIEESRKFIVFVTKEYMEKLQCKTNDLCKLEYSAATRVRTVENMIPVILEPEMLDLDIWRGPLLLMLGQEMYVDFSTPAQREANFRELLKRIDAVVKGNPFDHYPLEDRNPFDHF